MINSKFVYKNEKLNTISVKGHANYKKSGEDIVCSAVSAATLVTANAIEHLGLNQKIDLTVDEGYFKLTMVVFDSVIQGLMENLEYTLNDLQKQYPKYIKNQKEG
ncbi:MAG: ribosomal-processing cysteine protease Prp [Tenericutes bacterium HGW-Tenericutes-3]|nr:MAG: ribosomal-processing cysteine protease Prp [Tenericutes bacterium HGW-Tenericutes-3]